jgi:hypothetical protein
VLGLASVLWAGRFVQTVVYGVSTSDPLTIGGAVVLIAAVTALAGGLPARRASNVNPIEALRHSRPARACGTTRKTVRPGHGRRMHRSSPSLRLGWNKTGPRRVASGMIRSAITLLLAGALSAQVPSEQELAAESERHG